MGITLNNNETGWARLLWLYDWAHKYSALGKKVWFAGLGKPTLPIPPMLVQNAIKYYKGKIDELSNKKNSNLASTPERVMCEALKMDYSSVKLEDELEYEVIKEINYNMAPENLLFTTGGMSALNHIFEYFSKEEGRKKIIIAAPYYPYYAAYKDNQGNSIIEIVDVLSNKQYRLTAKLLKDRLTKDISAVVFCNPNNPLGTALDLNDWREIIDLFVEKKEKEHLDIKIICDESYIEMCFKGKGFSLLEALTIVEAEQKTSKKQRQIRNLKNNIIVLRSPTKSLSVAGERMGVVIVFDEKIREIIRQIQMEDGVQPSASLKHIYANTMLDIEKNGMSLWKSTVRYYYNAQIQYLSRKLKEIGVETFNCDTDSEIKGGFYINAMLGQLINSKIKKNKLSDLQIKTLEEMGFERNTEEYILKSDVDIAAYLLVCFNIFIMPFSCFMNEYEGRGIVRITCSGGQAELDAIIDSFKAALENACENNFDLQLDAAKNNGPMPQSSVQIALAQSAIPPLSNRTTRTLYPNIFYKAVLNYWGEMEERSLKSFEMLGSFQQDIINEFLADFRKNIVAPIKSKCRMMLSSYSNIPKRNFRNAIDDCLTEITKSSVVDDPQRFFIPESISYMYSGHRNGPELSRFAETLLQDPHFNTHDPLGGFLEKYIDRAIDIIAEDFKKFFSGCQYDDRLDPRKKTTYSDILNILLKNLNLKIFSSEKLMHLVSDMQKMQVAIGYGPVQGENIYRYNIAKQLQSLGLNIEVEQIVFVCGNEKKILERGLMHYKIKYGEHDFKIFRVTQDNEDLLNYLKGQKSQPNDKSILKICLADFFQSGHCEDEISIIITFENRLRDILKENIANMCVHAPKSLQCGITMVFERYILNYQARQSIQTSTHQLPVEPQAASSVMASNTAHPSQIFQYQQFVKAETVRSNQVQGSNASPAPNPIGEESISLQQEVNSLPSRKKQKLKK